MNAAPVYDIQARRAASPIDARQIVDNIADSVANLDAQIRSFPFQRITDEKIAAAERNVTLIRGMLAELRAQITPRGAA